jgi:hypothetical protein|tara:strand:- start:213 stop:401 length:189 start_codon:yes stop_codon:yes gene_type:complete
MKSFQEIREAASYSKRVKGIVTTVSKKGNRFVATIDGDRLDDYKTEKEAIKMIDAFMKNYKG